MLMFGQLKLVPNASSKGGAGEITLGLLPRTISLQVFFPKHWRYIPVPRLSIQRDTRLIALDPEQAKTGATGGKNGSFHVVLPCNSDN
jgi:hypothetical protein